METPRRKCSFFVTNRQNCSVPKSTYCMLCKYLTPHITYCPAQLRNQSKCMCAVPEAFCSFWKGKLDFCHLSLSAVTRNKIELNLLDVFQLHNIILKSNSQCLVDLYIHRATTDALEITAVNCGRKTFPSSLVPSRAPPFQSLKMIELIFSHTS